MSVVIKKRPTQSTNLFVFLAGLINEMRMQYFLKSCAALLALMAASAGLARGQSADEADFSGVIGKYDTAFDGIGPRVYFLPPPASKEEQLSDKYEAKVAESEIVREYLDNLKYTTRIKDVGNIDELLAQLERQLDANTSLEGLVLKEIARHSAAGNVDMVANLENYLAKEYLSTGNVQDAIIFFETALYAKASLRKREDVDILTHNLAVGYEYLQNLGRAEALHREVYNRAVSARNSAQQVHSLADLALVKAKQGNYAEAENDLIRTVIPMARRANDAKSHAIALIVLADVYSLQNRYPEAQWFLVQAKQIALQKDLDILMPEIIFSLAENKKESGNPRVAIQEYEEANDLVKGQADRLFGMQLAIQDALGDLYHQSGNYEQAATALSQYDALKSRFFHRSFSANN